MYLFVDVETTGLPLDWDAPATAIGNWPRIVQIAWLFARDDQAEAVGTRRIVKPDGFTIPRDASQIHGITTKRAITEGTALRLILGDLSNLLSQTTTIVAHNINYDAKVIGAEYIRAGLRDPLTGKSQRCTMQESVNWCKIRHFDQRRPGFKWPTLNELHRKLFRSEIADSHDALNDCVTCMKCYLRLKELGVMS